MPEITQTAFLSTVERVVRSNMSGYRDQHDWEDAIQEGVIRAWRDMREGERGNTHIIRRAKIWAKTHMTDDHHLPTGHPGRETTGIVRQADLVRAEKVRGYVEHFYRLHDRLPKATEVAQALGISKSSASYHIKTRNEMRGGYAVREDGEGHARLDRKSYRNVPLFVTLSGGDEEIGPEAEFRAGLITFEDDVCSQDSFEHLMSLLAPQYQEVLRYYHLDQMTYKEIAEIIGLSRQATRKRVEMGHKLLRRFLVGEVPQKVEQRGKDKQGRQRATHCKRGHAFTNDNVIQQSNGRGVACKTCNNIRRRENYRRKKGK